MSHGSEKLFCVGIVGDGCGGGREFIIDNEKLSAYDPLSKKSITLLEDIKKPISIHKNKCIIIIICEEENIQFDLSLMRRIL